MKTKILQLTAIMLILAGMMIACGKDKEDTQGNVPYKTCDCTGEEVIGIKLPEEAWLVADSAYDRKDSIAYYATFNYNKSHDKIIVNICNFPDFAKNWDGIFLQGREVYLSGKLYNTCYELPHYEFELCFDMILTNLKLK